MKLLSANVKWKTANLCAISSWFVFCAGIIGMILEFKDFFPYSMISLMLGLTGFGLLKAAAALIDSSVAIGIKAGALKDDIPEDAQYVEDAPSEENTSNPQ